MHYAPSSCHPEQPVPHGGRIQWSEGSHEKSAIPDINRFFIPDKPGQAVPPQNDTQQNNDSMSSRNINACHPELAKDPMNNAPT